MEHRPLGLSGVRVSALGLGTMTFVGAGSRFFEGVGGVDLAGARDLLAMAADVGVNLVDTADVYSRGACEEMLGAALQGRRDHFLIATKCHGRMTPDPNGVGQSWHHIIASCEASLRRLGVDHIDIYQVHGYDAWVRWEECLGTLTDLQREGKIRLIGASNLSASQLMKSLWKADVRNLTPFSSLQANYSLVAREAEHELLPLCAAEGLGFLVWSPLAGGFLSGKYRTGDDSVGRRGAVGDPGTIEPRHGSKVLDALERASNLCGAPMSTIAIRYLLEQPGVTSVLVGARDLEQLRKNLEASDLELPAEVVDDLRSASQKPLPYPYWHQATYNTDRSKR